MLRMLIRDNTYLKKNLNKIVDIICPFLLILISTDIKFVESQLNVRINKKGYLGRGISSASFAASPI